jgi:hypothetical protein
MGQLAFTTQASPDPGIVGTTQTGAAGVRESVARIMARQARSGTLGQSGVRALKPRYLDTGGAATPNPDSPQTSRWPVTAGNVTTPQTGPLTPQVISTSFLGAQLGDTIGYVPPDSMADVGTNQIVVCVNGRIRSFTRSGVRDGALDTTTDSFFNSVLHGSNTSDPRVRYDRLSGRWFITMITVNTPNFVLIAVSSGPTITSASSFTFFSFQADPSNFGDYDTLGVDANALYIGVNVFNSSGSFVNTTGFVVNKANLLSGTLTVTTFANLLTSSGHPSHLHGPFTPHGVNNDDPAAAEGYFIGVDYTSTGTLVVRRVSNPGGIPSISTDILVTVPATTSPKNAVSVPAQGSSLNLDALDGRLFATRMHNGSLWTAHNLPVDGTGTANSSGGRIGSRWYQLSSMTTTPTLIQSGTLFDSAGSNPRNFWIPSCAMSGQGHMALGCSVAGASEFAEIATAGRLASDPLGSIQSPTTAVTSSTTYNIGSQNNAYRWGDFSVTTVDPADDMTFWTVQEYCNATDSWGVQVVKLLAPPPALPISCSPSTVTQAQANVSVVLSGSTANGAGFFDPGPGFPNHITASVNGGGVTVNSIAYDNPGTVTMNLAIGGNAALGPRTVTVTNPDGQAATSLSGLLTIEFGTNLPPTLSPISNRTIAVGMALAITNVASDPDGDSLTFGLGAGAGTNATINPTNGLFTWTPAQAQIGTNAFSVIVTDSGSPPLSATQSFSVTVVQSNRPPVLAPIANRIIAVGMTLTFTNVASDPDGDKLTFGLGTGAATNATLNPTNGIFNWSPIQAQIGSNSFSVIVTDSGLPPLTVTQSFSVTVVQSNSPPVLAAISNRTIAVGMILTITNVASDSDGDRLTFSLGAGAATNATLNPTNGILNWSPVQAQIGSNAFGVIVTDSGVPPLSATQSFSVTVIQSNSPPLLAPIANRTIAVGMALTFTNVASDPDGDQLTFSLGAGAATNATINPTNGIFNWAPIQAQIGSNAFSVIVTDSGLPPLTATQSFSVTVVQSNSPPVLAPIANQTIAVGMTLTITNVAGDPDGDPLTFSLGAGAAPNASVDPTNGIFNWVPGQAQIGSSAFSVVVTDSSLPPLSATQSFSVTVVQSNSPPSLTAISNQTIAVGMTLTITNVASDSDGDELTFSLGDGAATNATINPANGLFAWSPVQAQIGSNAFSVIVTDSGVPLLSATQSFNVTVVQSNSPPVLAPIANRTIAVGMILTITNVASDSDGDQLAFSLGAGAVPNATINPTNGLFTWSPGQPQLGSNSFSVIVTDSGLPPLSATQGFIVTVVQSNSPPVLAPIANRTIVVGMTLTITNVAGDSDGDQLTFSLGAGAPANASVDPANGVFTWTPDATQTGATAFAVTVTDNGLPPLSATQGFTVTVLGSNTPPILAAISNQTVAVGMTLTITNLASDSDGDQLTFSLGDGAATNAAINPTNGVFAWAPVQEQIGSNAFSVIVTDSGLPPLSATQSFSVTVVQSNSPPSLAPIANQTIAVGMSLTITNVAGDPDGDQLTFSLGAGAAPNASVDPANGIFNWAPGQAQIGSTAFSVIVTDSGLPPLSATQGFTVIVLASNTPPVLAAISNQTVAVGMTLAITNVAGDSDGDQLTFSLGDGSATNAAINPTNGVFTWTPTPDQIGTNAFSVLVTDSGLPPLSATQAFTVTVLASNNPPVLAPIADQTIYALLTLVLTNSATDPDVPPQVLTLSLDPGAPAGASIGATNGLFTWTPTDAQTGTNSITVRVTDNGLPNLSAAQTFQVNVLPRPKVETLDLFSNLVTLTWSSISGTTYRVQFRTNLTGGAWADLVPDVSASGASAGAMDPVATNDARFYRVFVVP